MGVANFVSGKPVMVPYTNAGADILGGDIVVINSTPFVAHVSNPAFAGASKVDALAATGGVYQVTAGGALAIGNRAFYDPTAKKFYNATSAGRVNFGIVVGGPSGNLSGAAPSADGQDAYVLHAPAGA
jgi:hypothetical protein